MNIKKRTKINKILQVMLVVFQLIWTIFQFCLIIFQHSFIFHDFSVISLQYLIQKFLLICIIAEDLWDNIVLGSLRISGSQGAYTTFVITATTTSFLLIEAIGILLISIFYPLDTESHYLMPILKMAGETQSDVIHYLITCFSFDVACLCIWMVLCIMTTVRYYNW